MLDGNWRANTMLEHELEPPAADVSARSGGKCQLMSKTSVLHLIANAHLDPVWQWRWPEGCTEIRSTCRAACDFLSADPALKFSRSSAGDLRWLERCEPALLRRMARLVRAGQWENVGGWWTQPDCNIPNGESFVRQALYGQAFFKERLGGAAVTGYNVDSFGHNANLPQILAKCGLPYYVFMRPGQQNAPHIPMGYFHWEGVDGTRVLAFHLFDPYNMNPQWAVEPSMSACRAYLEKGATHSAMYFYGMGDHGGGPTRRSLAALEKLRREPGMPELVYSTTREAFAAVEAEEPTLPVFRGELQIQFPGCYAAHSEIKELNRRAEEALLAAERLSVAASALRGARYPAGVLTEAWKDVLQNQFHDILSGTAFRPAYVDARDQYGRAIMIAEEALNAAQQSIAAKVDTRGEGQAILLFNPHPFPVTGYFETGNIITGALREEIKLNRAGIFTDDGRQLPVQYIAPNVFAGSTQRYLFPMELPSLGYRLYRIRQLEAPAGFPGRARATANLLENDRLRVTVAGDGLHITDILTGRTFVEGLQPLVIDDPSDTWGNPCEHFDQVAGAMEFVSSRVLESGPLRAALRMEYRFGASKLWLDVLLCAGERAIEFRGKAWWLEKQRMLKLAIPVPGALETSMQEIPYAALQRPNNGKEWPIQQWADLSSRDAGVTLLNAGKYSMSVQGNQLRPTLLRATPYVWLRSDAYPWEGMEIDWRDEDWMIDQGIGEFRLRAIFHDGDWRTAGIPQAARLFNRLPELVMESSHRGKLPTQLSFVQAEGGVRVEVLKQAEDGRGMVLRAVEPHGVHATARFRLHTPAIEWEAAFTPWEIKTFRIADGAARDEGMLETGVVATVADRV